MEHSSNIKYYKKGECLLFGDPEQRNGVIVAVIDDPEWMEIIMDTLNLIMENHEWIRENTDSIL